MYRLAILGMLLSALLATAGCSENRPKKYLLDAEGLPLDPADRERVLAERAAMEIEQTKLALEVKKEAEKAVSAELKRQQEETAALIQQNRQAEKEMEFKAAEAQAQIIAEQKALAEAARKKALEDKALLEKQEADYAKAEEERLAKEAKEGKPSTEPAPK